MDIKQIPTRRRQLNKQTWWHGNYFIWAVVKQIYIWMPLSNRFQAVDQDKSGKISANELQKALVVGNGSHFSIEACELLVKLFSPGNSRLMDFQGFQQLFTYVNQWKTSFQTYDKDRSGAIDKNELGLALVQMGYRLSEKSVEAVLNKFASKPGQITFDSFILACVQLHQLTSKL